MIDMQTYRFEIFYRMTTGEVYLRGMKVGMGAAKSRGEIIKLLRKGSEGSDIKLRKACPYVVIVRNGQDLFDKLISIFHTFSCCWRLAVNVFLYG